MGLPRRLRLLPALIVVVPMLMVGNEDLGDGVGMLGGARRRCFRCFSRAIPATHLLALLEHVVA